MMAYSDQHWGIFRIGVEIIPADKALFIDLGFFTIGFHKKGAVG